MATGGDALVLPSSGSGLCGLTPIQILASLHPLSRRMWSSRLEQEDLSMEHCARGGLPLHKAVRLGSGAPPWLLTHSLGASEYTSDCLVCASHDIVLNPRGMVPCQLLLDHFLESWLCEPAKSGVTFHQVH